MVGSRYSPRAGGAAFFLSERVNGRKGCGLESIFPDFGFPNKERDEKRFYLRQGSHLTWTLGL
jgi:hypothetical protein